MAGVERWPILGRRRVMTPLFLGGGGGEYDIFILPIQTYFKL